MRPSQVALAIESCVAMQRPVMVWGPPGVGKSDSVRQCVLKMRAHYVKKANLPSDLAAQAMAEPLECGAYFGLIDFRAALRDAVDIMGLPGAANGATFYNAPAGLPRGTWRGIVFLDEINSAPAQTQAALYQLVLDRRVGDYVLPVDAFIVCAGNRQNDRGVVHRMPDPLADRMFHVDFEPDLTDWTHWALANSIRPEVVAFLRFRPALLHSHDTARQCHAFSTPRGWADVSKVLDLQSPIESELVRGRVGDASTGEFLAFLKLYRGMVSPDQVLANPTSAPVPDNAGVLYALAEALARRASLKNFGSVMEYAKRMPKEYAQALVSSAVKLTDTLIHTPEFIQWSAANG